MADPVSNKSDGDAGDRRTSASEKGGAAPATAPAAGGATPTPTPGATGAPASATAGNNKNAKTRPVKDKRCLFCGQEFTASSLGRHYDTFITRDRDDGVHDLDEIRRIRSSVTRRTVKPNVVSGSSTKGDRESTEPPVADQKAAGAQTYPKIVPPTKLNPTSGKQGYRVILNQPSWEATGVINDIPKPTQQKSTASGYELGKLKSNADQETVRALELALREVLDSVKAASTRTQQPPSPFDVEIESLDFPAMCLYALPPTPSLFSTAPFTVPNYIPLTPPTIAERDSVLYALRSKIFQWKTDRQAMVAESERQRTPSSNVVSEEYARDVEMIERLAMQHEEALLNHLNVAFTAWMNYSQEIKRDIWLVEVMRAFAKESQKRKEAEDQLARTQQEVNRLKAQVDRLASCQWPREFAIFPPEMLPLPPAVVQELNANNTGNFSSAECPRWDYDNLVSKWKRVVRHDMTMGRPGTGFDNPLDRPANTRTSRAANDSTEFYTNRTLPAPRPSSPPPRLNPINNPDPPSLQQQPPDGDSSRLSKRRKTSYTDDQRLPSLSTTSTPLTPGGYHQAPVGQYSSPYPVPQNGINGGSAYDGTRIPSLHAVPGMSQHLGPPSTNAGNPP